MKPYEVVADPHIECVLAYYPDDDVWRCMCSHQHKPAGLDLFRRLNKRRGDKQ